MPTVKAEADSCWGAGADPRITCTELTPALLTSLEDASKADLKRAMGGLGEQTDTNVFYFISNYGGSQGGGSGYVYFTLGSASQVAAIHAEIDPSSANDAVESHFDWP